MKRLISITKLALLAAPLASMGAPAPEGLKEEPTAFAARHAGVDGELSLAETRVGIAELEPMLVASRDYQGAYSRLAELKSLLQEPYGRLGKNNNPKEPETAAEFESVRLILLAQVEVLLAEGKMKQAESVLGTSVFDGADRRNVKLKILDDPRIAETMTYLEAKLAGRSAAAPRQYMLLPYDSDDDAIDKIVEDTLSETDMAVVSKVMGALGVRAVPALAKAITANLDVAPSQRPDPLTLLMDVDPLTAAVVMKAHMDQGGYLWKRRMAATISKGMQHWFDYSTKPAICLAPEGLGVVEILLADEEVGAEAMGQLPRLSAAYGSPSIYVTMVDALASENGERRAAAHKLLTSSGPIRALMPYLEAALDSPFVDVRAAAAQQLADLAWNEALVARSQDPSPLVREWLTQLLKVRMPNQHVGDWDLERGARTQSLDESGRELLLALLKDPVLSVRRIAAECLRYWPKEYINVTYSEASRPGEKRTNDVWRFLTPPNLEVLLELAQDPDMKVRESLLEVVNQFEPGLGIPILEILAASPEMEIGRRGLQSIPKDWFEVNAADCLGIFQAFLAANPDQSQLLFQQLASSRFRFLSSEAGTEALVRWLMPLGRDVVGQVIGLNYTTQPSLKLYLSPQTYREYVELYDGDGASVNWLSELVRDVPSRFDGVLYSMGTESSGTLRLRLLSLMTVAKNENQLDWQGPLQSILQDPIWADGSLQARGYAHIVSGRINRLSDEDAIPFGLSIVNDQLIPDLVVDQIVGAIGLEREGGLVLGEQIKQRFYDPKDTAGYSYGLISLVNSMPFVPGLRDDALLAALIVQPNYEDDVVDAIKALKDPTLLPLLADVVRNRHGARVWKTTVNHVLPVFLTDESAALLLEAASLAQDAEVREKCMESLESMRTYFLARDYWTQRKLDGASSKTAIAELMELLDDPDQAVRVHAIRGLATFDAIGAIPRLIRLLKDPSPEVAKAAGLALESLNRPQVDEPD